MVPALDHRLVSNGWAAEPYPLDPQLKIYGIGEGPDGLLAATDHGIYSRDPLTSRWRQLSAQPALQVVAAPSLSLDPTMWIVPARAPDEIWVSSDGGQTWAHDDAGLEGVIVAPLAYTRIFGSQIHAITLRAGRYIVWERQFWNTPGAEIWREFTIVPGPAVAYIPGGVPSGLIVQFTGAFVEILTGSTDGKLYRLIPELRDDLGEIIPMHWDVAHDFGPGRYPWPIGNLPIQLANGIGVGPNTVTVLDLATGNMQLYSYQPSAEDPNTGSFSRSPFPQFALGHVHSARRSGSAKVVRSAGGPANCLRQHGADAERRALRQRGLCRNRTNGLGPGDGCAVPH